MAFIELDKQKLIHNYTFLDRLFKSRGIKWGVVSKLLCGTPEYLKLLIELGVEQVLDSRVSNLRAVKEIKPDIETIYIKPPAKRGVPSVIKYADISFNTEYSTIKLLSEEAGRQNKIHKVMVMIEMGDLREGVMGEYFVEFYERIFQLPNIEVVGIGTNLNCLNGVLPSSDKLIQLSLYEQLIEAKFNKNIPYVSGGTSVAIPLITKKVLPAGITHFRVGETLFLGNNLYTEKPFKAMKQDVFTLYAEIIELIEKPVVPSGDLGKNVAGETVEINESDYGRMAHRAILDIGLLDIDVKNLFPVDKKLKISGASSDMIVLEHEEGKPRYKVGDLVKFKLNYMGILSILNSGYIEKRVVQREEAAQIKNSVTSGIHALNHL